MKKNLRKMMAAICMWGLTLLASGLVVSTLTACSSDDEPTGNGVDDLAYEQFIPNIDNCYVHFLYFLSYSS